MSMAPLQLNQYFFPVVSVIANPDFSPQMAEGKGLPMLTVDVAVTAHDETNYEVRVSTVINHTDENPSQYEVNLQAIGFFSINADISDKEVLARTACASILYSACREFLLSITSRGPWTPIMLNLMSFRPDHPEKKP